MQAIPENENTQLKSFLPEALKGRKHCGLPRLLNLRKPPCFVFFYDMLSQQLPQEETEERLGKHNALFQQVLETGGRATGGSTRVVRRQRTGERSA